MEIGDINQLMEAKNIAILVLFSALLYFLTRRNLEFKKYKERSIRHKKEFDLQAEQLRAANTELSNHQEELLQQTEQLSLAYNELAERESQIAEIYVELKDSIHASHIIQESILPLKEVIRKTFPEFFVLNKPKDTVSGDFYMYREIDNKIILAAIDCTGHGVSGAFMSINAFHFLNKAIEKNTELTAANILNTLNEEVVKFVSNYERKVILQDGMDISLCIIDKQNNTVQFSGASNPLYILRDGNIIQVKGNKYSIGLSLNGKINTFDNHEMALEKGDILYLFSDGYADQFGGEKGTEKFMYSRFRDFLVEISPQPLETQETLLKENLDKWRGETAQLDDVLVMGLKII
jgi:serine phosphatase RsbU (regulator of sigma subunit)